VKLRRGRGHKESKTQTRKEKGVKGPRFAKDQKEKGKGTELREIAPLFIALVGGGGAC